MTPSFMPRFTTKEELDALQLSGFKWTVNHAYNGSEFYRRRLDEAGGFVENMRDQYWGEEEAAALSSHWHLTDNPHDRFEGINISVAFGAESDVKPYGKTAVLLRDVHFTGRSNVIRIDEDVFVEAYPFFARDVFSTRNPYREVKVTADSANATADQIAPGEVIHTIESN